MHTSRKFSSDNLQLMLLALLQRKPAHGYELIKEFEERSQGFYVPSPGMIYPALTFLEEIGLTQVEMDGSRKRYLLTAEGSEHLQGKQAEVDEMLDDLQEIGKKMEAARRAFEDEGADIDEEAERSESGRGPILDAKVNEQIQLLSKGRAQRSRRGPRRTVEPTNNPHDFADRAFSIDPSQGELAYLLIRASGATRVAEFATSFGLSTLYLAAAVRDNGGGIVIGSEIVPEKLEKARQHLRAAGLEAFVELRLGDARDTLRDLGGKIDFLFVDGWPSSDPTSLALQVFELVAPQLREGGIILHDNGEQDFLDHARNPANGFLTMGLPLKNGTEFCVKVASR